jgi:hypothetical protein
MPNVKALERGRRIRSEGDARRPGFPKAGSRSASCS